MCPKLNREIFFSKHFQTWVKRPEKRVRDTQAGVVKATAAFIKVSAQIIYAERENYLINNKELTSVALDGVILLGNVSRSLNNLRIEKLRQTLSRNLQHLCDSSNLVTSYLLGDDLPRRIKEAKETARIYLSQKLQRSHNNSGYNNQNGYSSK